MSDQPLFKAVEAREVALPIFVELVARNVTFTDSNVKMGASPENIAKLSFKLAAVFMQVQDELNEANMPKNPTYKLDSGDIATWGVK